MAPADKYCRNCKGPMRLFVELSPAERALAAERDDVDPGTLDGYRRCSTDSCRRVQLYFNKSKGFNLPERLGWPNRE
ncbi:hypothetical protein ACOKM3_27085 [Streptomyces sp. BH106]|uniref:hypothetical protein n=1 Tax=Streptomyces sp. BH106 TaxID=3410409 RepID=UPI003CF5FDFC